METIPFLLMLLCALNLISVGALVLQKCCPSDHVFYVDRSSDFTCLQSNQTWAPSLLEDYTNVTWSILEDLGSFNLTDTCHGITMLSNVTIESFYLESGNLVNRNWPGVQHRDFCLDQTSEGHTMALTCPCSKGGVCVNVCCDMGEILDASGQQRVCQEENTAIDWKLKTSEQLFALKYYSFPHCANDTEHLKILNDKTNLKKYEFEILANGTLFIHNAETKEWKEPSEYCVAMTRQENDETPSMNVFTCNTMDNVIGQQSQPSRRTAIYVTLFMIGTIFYLATLLVHALVPNLRSAVRGLSLMAHCACMLAAHIALIILQLVGSTLTGAYCQILAYSCKFTIVGGFFWMNVMCLDLTNNFKSKESMARSLNLDHFSELRKFKWYCVYAFGVPFVLMMVILGVDHSGLDHSNPFKPNIGRTSCFFPRDSAAIVLYFYGPLGLLILMNVFLFIFVGYKFASAGFLSKNMSSNNKQRHLKRVILFLKLSALMGIPWVMEFVGWAVGGEDYFWYFTDTINMLRSIIIFYMFCCKPKVWEMLKDQSILTPIFQWCERCCCRKIADHRDDPMASAHWGTDT